MKSLIKYLKNKIRIKKPLLLNKEKYFLSEIRGYVHCVDIFMMTNILRQFRKPSYIEFGVYAGRSFFNVLINAQKYLDYFPNKKNKGLRLAD